MSAETVPLCFPAASAETERSFPDRSRPDPLSQSGEQCPLLGHGEGWQWGRGGCIEVEVGSEERGGLTETEGFPEGGGGFRGTAKPSPATLGGSSRREGGGGAWGWGGRGFTARRRVPAEVRSEQQAGPWTPASGTDLQQSGRALGSRIPTHLKRKEERNDKTSDRTGTLTQRRGTFETSSDRRRVERGKVCDRPQNSRKIQKRRGRDYEG